MGQLRNETKGIQLESRPARVMGRPSQAAQVRLGPSDHFTFCWGVTPCFAKRMLWHLYIVLGCLANMIWFVWPPLLTDILPGCLWPNLINLRRQAPQPHQRCCIHFCKWQVFEPHFWDDNIYVYPIYIYIYEHPYIYTSMCTIIKTYMLGQCPICKSTHWVQPIMGRLCPIISLWLRCSQSYWE